MFTLNDRFNISIDYDAISKIQELEKNSKLTTDDLHFCLLAMVGCMAIHNEHIPMTFTTLDNIIMTMAQDINVKVKPKVRTGLMDGFNNLRKHGIIKMNEPFTGDKKQVVSIVTEELGHYVSKDVKYFQISRQELAAIIKGSNVPHHLVVIMINFCSRFNLNAYIDFAEGKWSKKSCSHDSDYASYKRLSTWASQDTVRETWYNEIGKDLKRVKAWEVTDAMFSRYCNELITLGIFDRIIANEQGINLSYYFRPMHRECVEYAIKMNLKQQAYMKSQQSLQH